MEKEEELSLNKIYILCNKYSNFIDYLYKETEKSINLNSTLLDELIKEKGGAGGPEGVAESTADEAQTSADSKFYKNIQEGAKHLRGDFGFIKIISKQNNDNKEKDLKKYFQNSNYLPIFLKISINDKKNKLILPDYLNG